MRKNAIVITPEKHMYIHPLPDDYDAMLDELHAIAHSPYVAVYESPDLGEPYCIALPAFPDEQRRLPKLINNPVATCLLSPRISWEAHGIATIIWLDDREGYETLAGLTDEEAEFICTTLDLDFSDLTWERDKEFDILSNPGFDGYYDVDEDRYKDDRYEDADFEEAGYGIEDYDDYDEPQREGGENND